MTSSICRQSRAAVDIGRMLVYRPMASEVGRRGRAAWPGIELTDAQLDAHLARLELPAEPHEDLYLACACALGDAPAIDAFERSILAQVGSFVGRIDASAQFVDEVRQSLR